MGVGFGVHESSDSGCPGFCGNHSEIVNNFPLGRMSGVKIWKSKHQSGSGTKRSAISGFYVLQNAYSPARLSSLTFPSIGGGSVLKAEVLSIPATSAS